MPVIGIGRADQALSVHASVAANSVAYMIAMAKARPGADVAPRYAAPTGPCQQIPLASGRNEQWEAP